MILSLITSLTMSMPRPNMEVTQATVTQITVLALIQVPLGKTINSNNLILVNKARKRRPLTRKRPTESILDTSILLMRMATLSTKSTEKQERKSQRTARAQKGQKRIKKERIEGITPMKMGQNNSSSTLVIWLVTLLS